MFVIKTYTNICKCTQNSADFPSNSEQKKGVCKYTFGMQAKLNTNVQS